MRMRKKKNLFPRLARCERVTAADPAALRGNWRSLFPAASALYVELGCGKGAFAVEMARQNPDVLFVAMEKEPSAVVTAMEKTVAEGLANLFFIVGDASAMEAYFAPSEIDRLYINFCDPWTRGNRFKRRLTYRGFLAQYMKVVRPGASLCFKTDNR